MKFIFIALGAVALLLAAKPFKNENLNPVVEEPQMPGTPVKVKELNTSPNPTAGKNKSDTFRGSTINVKKSKFEAKPGELKKKAL